MSDQVWIWGLTLMGIILLLLEIVIPGGIVGTLGAVCVLTAAYLASDHYGSTYAVLLFLGSSAIVAAAFYLFFRSPARKLLVLEDQLEANAPSTELYVGLQGTSLSALRPSGRAVFVLNGREKQVDVSANAEFIDQDQSIQIERIEGSRVFVNRA